MSENSESLCKCLHPARDHAIVGTGMCDSANWGKNPCGCMKFEYITKADVTARIDDVRRDYTGTVMTPTGESVNILVREITEPGRAALVSFRRDHSETWFPPTMIVPC
jgi:hypothetical protein